MITKKEVILDAAIDLFAERGVRDVSLEMIAEQANTSRSNIYHHYKNGKDEIIGHVLRLFTEIITGTLKDIEGRDNKDMDANSILSCLFLQFKDEDAGNGRKINKIIFEDYGYVPQIKKYLTEVFYEKREYRFAQILKLLISSGKAKPFDADMAARMLNKIFIAYALEDTFSYPFENDELPECLSTLRGDCEHIVNLILKGYF
jgi:AcrR family transcriptional regulator